MNKGKIVVVDDDKIVTSAFSALLKVEKFNDVHLFNSPKDALEFLKENTPDLIISDFLTESNWKKAIDFLLYNRREIMLIQVISPDELYPDFDGRIHMMDSEAIDIGDGRNMRMAITKKMMNAYQRALDEYEKEIIDFCAARNVTFFTISSDDPIEKVIFGKGYEAEVIK